MNLKKRMNTTQKFKISQIADIIDGFYEGNDNPVTYALTGLIRELTNDYVSEGYLKEKVALIITEAGVD